MALTPKQQQFVAEYLLDLNGAQAAIRAGYSRRTANRIASENLSKPDVQEAVAEGQRKRAERTAITQDDVIQALARIAYCDVRNLFDRRGQLLPLSELPADVSAGIASMTVEQPKGSNGAVVRIRMHDKLRALELLAKHLGMFRDPKSTEPPAVTVDAAAIAKMTDEELDRGLANVDKLIAAVTKTAA